MTQRFVPGAGKSAIVSGEPSGPITYLTLGRWGSVIATLTNSTTRRVARYAQRLKIWLSLSADWRDSRHESAAERLISLTQIPGAGFSVREPMPRSRPGDEMRITAAAMAKHQCGTYSSCGVLARAGHQHWVWRRDQARAAGSVVCRRTAMGDSFDIEGRPSHTRVVVAMSGGVDSSVTAALLADAGYDVVGITLQLYDHGAATHRKGACCAGRDIHDARAVAARLGIAHYVLDYESRFKEAVIDRFAESYVAGETPVPCVECNQSIKFRDRLETARGLGAKVLATGRYVASRALPGGGRALYRAREAERDQSYFLFATTPGQLDHLRFPLGDRTKAETRDLARHFGFSVADKQARQDISLVPTGPYAEVIERLRPGAAGPGDIVDLDGRVLGHHDGIIHFTVAQRRGLGVAAGSPLYVVRLRARSRPAAGWPRGGGAPREALRPSRIGLRDINWLGDGSIGEALERQVFVKVRSTRVPQPAWLHAGPAGGIEVELIGSEDGVSPRPACGVSDAGGGAAR